MSKSELCLIKPVESEIDVCKISKREENKIENSSNNNNNTNDSTDSKNNNIYVSYECGHILFYSSFQLVFFLLFSLHYRIYFLSIFNTGTVVMAFLHWSKPRLGLKRNIDFLMSFLNSVAHLYVACQISINSILLFFFNFILTTTLYFMGKHYNYNVYSTLYHASIHFTNNITVLTLYYMFTKKAIEHSL
ncbi:conserved membrane protein, unknown function [Hepatocystis sp. ex Piliocolobus tephrosceles]|nr:conserved membrane protein, unknown function [Hepatocystis sp. ex Piliocolobus tephrosceles]